MEHQSLRGDFAKYCIFFGNEEITLDEIKEEPLIDTQIEEIPQTDEKKYYYQN